MTAQIRSELLKQRSTRTGVGLFAGMCALVAFAVFLHAFGLAAERVDGSSEQLMVLGRGEVLGTLFAALLGAMSITGEIRHGTIRPTFLANPLRGRVVAAKVWASALLGAGFGLAAAALAAAAGTVALRSRGIEVQLDGGDLGLLVAGSAAAGALWAAIGVGVGALVRSQAPALIGISAWLLFVEGLLGGDLIAGVGDIRRLAPGGAAEAITGQDPANLLTPEAGLLLLALYALAATAAGWRATTHRDVA